MDVNAQPWKPGFETQLIKKAFVYHKRRSSIRQFFKQTFGFGTARPLLNRKYPATAKLTYWLPSLFIMGLDSSIILAIFGYHQLLYFYTFYFLLIFFDSLFQNKNLRVAFLSMIASLTQFFGYGLGFLKSYFFHEIK